MANLQLRELLLHDLCDDLSPQSAGGEHVGLVQTPDRGRGVLGEGEVGSETGDALDLRARVGLGVHGVTRTVILGAVTEVDTTGQLTDNVDVDTTADFGLERRAIDERVGGEEARSKVAECAHLLAKLQETLLGTDCASAPFLFFLSDHVVGGNISFNVRDHRWHREARHRLTLRR